MMPGAAGKTRPRGTAVVQPFVLVLALFAALAFVPALAGCIAAWENRRARQWELQRELLGGPLAPALARAFGNAAWTLWLTVLALPFGRQPRFDRCACAPCPHSPSSGIDPAVGVSAPALPSVILVHGLYHNPAAWFVMRRRLFCAGFADVRCYGYASFGRSFVDIAAGLSALIARTAAERPDGRVLLMGHSLGGLVIRAALADGRAGDGVEKNVAGVVSLGAPHGGSRLASMLGMGRLARGLAPDGEALRFVRSRSPAFVPWLSLFTPVDGVVIPCSCLLLGEPERAAGWRERALPAMSHVGLLYSRAAAREALAFLRDCAREGEPRRGF